MNKALVIALTLAVSAAVSAAAVTIQVDKYPTVAGFDAYIMTATAGAGEKIYAVEVDFVGAMRQTFAIDPNTEEPTLPIIFSTLSSTGGTFTGARGDSHFLFPAASLLVADQEESASKLYAGFAFASGAANPLAAQSLAIAQIVVPEGGEIAYTGNVIAAGDAGNVRSDFAGVIPEPATMSLLGLGALGLLRRRR